MKLLFASDIHGSLYYTRQLISVFNKEAYDRMILAGDILYHGPRNPLPKDYNPAMVAELLNEYQDKIICVRGNCDSEVDQMVLNFLMRSDYAQLFIDGYAFFITHGHLFEREMPKLAPGTVYVSGHTHLPVLEKTEIVRLNPGSIALPKGDYPPTYALFNNGEIMIKTFEEIVVATLKI